MSKLSANFTQNHLTVEKRTLRYLKGTAYLGLSYKKCADGNLTGYSDAHWADDTDDHHSTSGNTFFCGYSSKLKNMLLLRCQQQERSTIKNDVISVKKSKKRLETFQN